MIRVRRMLLPHPVAHLFRLHCSEDFYLKCGGLSDIVWLFPGLWQPEDMSKRLSFKSRTNVNKMFDSMNF